MMSLTLILRSCWKMLSSLVITCLYHTQKLSCVSYSYLIYTILSSNVWIAIACLPNYVRLQWQEFVNQTFALLKETLKQQTSASKLICYLFFSNLDWVSLAAYSGVGTKLQSFVEEYDLCVTLCACKLKEVLHQCSFLPLLSGFEGLTNVQSFVWCFIFRCIFI